MKKIRIVFALMLVAGLFVSTQAHSQAIVHKDRGWHLGDIYAYNAVEVFTPSGNINIMIQLQLPDGHPWIPEEGEMTYPFEGWYWGLLFIGEYTVSSDGKLQYNFHHKAKWE